MTSEVYHLVPESTPRSMVGRHCVIVEEAGHDLRHTAPCLGIGWRLRRRISSLISASITRIRSRRVFS